MEDGEERDMAISEKVALHRPAGIDFLVHLNSLHEPIQRQTV